MLGMLHEMWRMASVPPAPLILGAMVLTLAWSIAFRKQDGEAWVMCSVLLSTWLVELGMRTVLAPDSFRALLAVTDALCAFAALKLGSRNYKEWPVVVYTTLVYAIVVHVLWLFGVFQIFGTKNDYIALLNILLALRLVCIAFPGAAYVGKGIGGLLPHLRGAFAPAHEKAGRR